MHDEYVVVVLAGKHMPMLSGLFHFILCLRSPHIVRLYLNQLASCHFVCTHVHRHIRVLREQSRADTGQRPRAGQRERAQRTERVRQHLPQRRLRQLRQHHQGGGRQELSDWHESVRGDHVFLSMWW